MSFEFKIYSLTEMSESRWKSIHERLGRSDGKQSFQQAELYREVHGLEPLFMTCEKAGSLAGALLFFKGSRYAPALSQRNLSFLIPTANRLVPDIQWLHGPLVVDGDEKILKAFFAELFRRFDPKVYNYSFSLPYSKEAAKVVPEGAKIKQHASFVVDLQSPDLWERIASRSRRDVSRSERDGLTFRVLSAPQEVEAFWRELVAARKRDGLACPTARRREFLLASSARGTEVPCVALYEGKFVSGLVLRVAGGGATQALVWNSQLCIDKKLNGPAFLTWYAIKHCQSLGLKYFDLAGHNPIEETRSKKEVGIFSFKSKWNGTEYCELHGFVPAQSLRRRCLSTLAKRLS